MGLSTDLGGGAKAARSPGISSRMLAVKAKKRFEKGIFRRKTEEKTIIVELSNNIHKILAGVDSSSHFW
jgi:hypothetical protein